MFAAAGLLLLLGSPIHWGAKSMAFIVGVTLGVGALIALSDGNDVLGIIATNNWTKLIMGAGGVALVLLSTAPRVGRRRGGAPAATRRDREIESPAVLGNVGRPHVGRDAARGNLVAAVLQRRAHAIAALAHGRRRQAGDREGGQSAREMHLDADLVSVEPRLPAADQPREAHDCSGLLRVRALERGETLLERLELLARALEHGGLQVELLTRDEIHSFEPGGEQGQYGDPATSTQQHGTGAGNLRTGRSAHARILSGVAHSNARHGARLTRPRCPWDS